MGRTLINDAFYLINNDTFVRKNHSYKRVFTKKGREEAVANGIFFTPDLYNISHSEWKKIKSSLKDSLEFGISTGRGMDYVFCPHFLVRGRKLSGEHEYFSYIETNGNVVPRGVIPMEMGNTCFVMSQESARQFLEQRFSGVSCQPLVSDETVFPDEETEVTVREVNLFHIKFGEFVNKQEKIRDLRSAPPRRCANCGSVSDICFVCGLYLQDCPYCGEKAMERNERDEEAINNLWFDVEQKVPLIWFYEDNWKIVNKMYPFRGEKWSGNDFFTYGIVAACTGQAAKWLVENQFGYIGFSPLYVDVSNCSEEQRERIEAVRYKPRY